MSRAIPLVLKGAGSSAGAARSLRGGLGAAGGVAAARVPRGGGRWYIRRAMDRGVRRMLAEHLGPGASGRRLVDFGCGDQRYRGALLEHVETVVGYDLPGNAAADAELDEAGRVGLPDGWADVVWSTQVLEHVPDPAAYLAEAVRLLRPGGRLLLSTHGHWKYHPHPTDRWRWTSEGLRAEVERAGLEVRDLRGVLGLGAAGALLLQDAVVGRLPRRLRYAVASVGQGVCALADGLHDQAARDRDAAVYLVCAVRPELERAFRGPARPAED